MKKMHLMGLAVAVAMASTFAMAQAKPQTQPQVQPQQQPAQHRMKQIDTNGDGRISKEEAAKAPKFAERFDQMDVNKDGFVDKADREARMAQRRNECFDKADTDKNGQLSRDEFSKMHQVCGMDRSKMEHGKMRGSMQKHGMHHKMDATPAAQPAKK